MALLNSPEYKSEISDKSHKCANCGFPINIKKNSASSKKSIDKKNKEGSLLQPLNCGCILIFVIFFFIVALFFMISFFE